MKMRNYKITKMHKVKKHWVFLGATVGMLSFATTPLITNSIIPTTIHADDKDTVPNSDFPYTNNEIEQNESKDDNSTIYQQINNFNQNYLQNQNAQNDPNVIATGYFEVTNMSPYTQAFMSNFKNVPIYYTKDHALHFGAIPFLNMNEFLPDVSYNGENETKGEKESENIDTNQPVNHWYEFMHDNVYLNYKDGSHKNDNNFPTDIKEVDFDGPTYLYDPGSPAQTNLNLSDIFVKMNPDVKTNGMTVNGLQNVHNDIINNLLNTSFAPNQTLINNPHLDLSNLNFSFMAANTSNDTTLWHGNSDFRGINNNNPFTESLDLTHPITNNNEHIYYDNAVTSNEPKLKALNIDGLYYPKHPQAGSLVQNTPNLEHITLDDQVILGANYNATNIPNVKWVNAQNPKQLIMTKDFFDNQPHAGDWYKAGTTTYDNLVHSPSDNDHNNDNQNTDNHDNNDHNNGNQNTGNHDNNKHNNGNQNTGNHDNNKHNNGNQNTGNHDNNNGNQNADNHDSHDQSNSNQNNSNQDNSNQDNTDQNKANQSNPTNEPQVIYRTQIVHDKSNQKPQVIHDTKVKVVTKIVKHNKANIKIDHKLANYLKFTKEGLKHNQKQLKRHHIKTNEPIVKIIHAQKLSHNRIKYTFRQIGHLKHFTMILKPNDVTTAYYRHQDLQSSAHLKVKALKNLYAHSNNAYRKHNREKLYHKGDIIKIQGLENYHGLTRFTLKNGNVITSNKYYVQLIK